MAIAVQCTVQQRIGTLYVVYQYYVEITTNILVQTSPADINPLTTKQYRKAKIIPIRFPWKFFKKIKGFYELF